MGGYAATLTARKELAEMLARNLCTAMIAGPEMEEDTWKVFKKHTWNWKKPAKRTGFSVG